MTPLPFRSDQTLQTPDQPGLLEFFFFKRKYSPTPAATAASANKMGLTPNPAAGASTGGTGIGGGGALCATGGATSTAGSTHPGAVVCAVTTAADPHSAAAGAPPVSAVNAAHGATCCGTGVLAAAAVEQKTIDPATRNPTTPLNRELAILNSPGAAGAFPR
jgi:hypothetical protein